MKPQWQNTQKKYTKKDSEREHDTESRSENIGPAQGTVSKLNHFTHFEGKLVGIYAARVLSFKVMVMFLPSFVPPPTRT